jgi:hypothetical protein
MGLDITYDKPTIRPRVYTELWESTFTDTYGDVPFKAELEYSRVDGKILIEFFEIEITGFTSENQGSIEESLRDLLPEFLGVKRVEWNTEISFI